ncbi:MAG TPA: hypothetical protein VJ853_08825 [Thermoanaerobaculia bacterium]|nr:hypothetical protein [Thermoanaerobaculia bacterium]
MNDFDGFALFRAMDAKREQAGLTWAQVAREIWQQSAELNARRAADHPISAATLTGLARRGDCSCQHALFMLRWLGSPPEEFVGAPMRADATLPKARSDRRLRWNLRALHGALDAARKSRGLTWASLARELRCTPNQLMGLRRVKYAISMRLAMRIVAWLDRAASAFIFVSPW